MHLIRSKARREAAFPTARRLRERFAGALGVVFAAGLAAGALTVSASAAPVEASSPAPRAVIIVGPSSSSTASFLEEGDLFADQAETAGMEVTRIFHPRATWARVRPALEGANLVVYFGHGNGWPSAYAPFQENTKNGFGLNGYEGAPAGSHVYYGGNVIRDKVRLAEGAVVILYRSCYSAGNGEEGAPVPSRSVAIERVDNFAAAFLHEDVGASVVMAYRTKQWVDLAAQLTRPGLTMDDVFRTPSAKSGWPMSGWIGTNDFIVDSERTTGARLHLDPHSTGGYSRAITGDLGFTTDEWRGSGDPPSADLPAPDLRIAASDETPGRGQTVTFRVISGVPLSAAPRLRIRQPGLTAYVVDTTWVKLHRYRVHVPLASGGSAGTLRIKAISLPTGSDKTTVLRLLPLH